MAKNRPVGVKILAILAYIGAVLSILGALAMFIGSAFVGPLLANIPGYTAILGAAGAAIAITLGIVLIAFAVLDYFIGKGLWNGKNWARIVTLVFAVIGLIGSIWPLSIVQLVIDALIIWYLGFNKQAIAYFK